MKIEIGYFKHYGLSIAPYNVELGDKGGFILQHSVGSFPSNSEIDIPLTCADYYVEAGDISASSREYACLTE